MIFPSIRRLSPRSKLKEQQNIQEKYFVIQNLLQQFFSSCLDFDKVGSKNFTLRR